MYKYFILGFIAWVTNCQTVFAAPMNYEVSAIPKPLQAYANAVVRLQESSTEVKALDQVIYRHKEVITILNGNGAEYGDIHLFYDKSRQVKNLRAAIYDAQGQLIKKLSASDFQDVSAISDFSLFEDNRVKYYSPQVKTFPFTVEYEYELRIKHTFYFPNWVPQPEADVAVEQSSYRFICRPDYKIRLKEYNLPVAKTEKTEGGVKITEWSAKNIAALKPEPYSPPAQDYLTMVQVAPVSFQYEGIPGQFLNWQEYGKWAYDNMIKGRDNLPPATVAHIKQLVKDIESPVEKVKKVYEYAQQKNRYISVQIGIGGLQPMKAEEVDRLGYGDCKALTNYTKALLKVAEIPSIYTEVNAGNNKKSYLPEFASAFQGNHVILCVPMPKDTIWLECTSRDAPLGYLGSFTDDRNVLLCTENGGVIAHTKRYNSEHNQQTRTAIFDLDNTGKLTGQIETRFAGTQFDNRESIINKSPKDQLEALQKIYPINNLEITKYTLKQQKTDQPTTVEQIEVKAEQYGTSSDNLLIVPINHLNREISVPKEIRNRKNKVRIIRGFLDEDNIQYNLPADSKLDYIPQTVEMNSAFGSYQAKTTVQGNKLVFTRRLLLKQGEYAPDAYEQLVDFLKKVVAADTQKFVLAKK